MPESVQHPCGYCGSMHSRPLLHCTDTAGMGWNWRSCQDCGALFLGPRPTSSQLAAAYSQAYYGESDTKFEGLAERFIEHCRHARAGRLAHDLPSGAAVLDVGCGNGGFLAALAQHGSFRLFGTELEGASARRAARRPELTLKVGELEQGDFPDDSLSLVTLFHVFEHLTQPRLTLTTIHRALAPDGRLVVSFPNISSVQASLFRGHWLHLDPPRHLFLFPTKAFERAITTAGFTVVGRRCFSVEQNPFGFIQSTLNTVLPRDLLYERLKGNTAYAPEHGPLSLFLQKAFAGLALGPAILLDALESGLGRGATVEYTLRKVHHKPDENRG